MHENRVPEEISGPLPSFTGEMPMNKMKTLGYGLLSSCMLVSHSLFAAEPINDIPTRVPEIDGAHAALALALTAGIVAIAREIKRRK